jgi:hypothetical protein
LQAFSVLSDDALPAADWREGRSLSVQLEPTGQLNDVLAALLPHAAVLEAQEAVPSMNDIFIETVQKATA